MVDPDGAGQNGVAHTTFTAEGVKVLAGGEVAEGQEQLDVRQVASDILIANPPENGNIGIELVFAAELVPVEIEIVPLRMLQVEKSQLRACWHRGIVAWIDIQGMAQNRELQAGSQQQRAEYRVGLLAGLAGEGKLEGRLGNFGQGQRAGFCCCFHVFPIFL
ncbi:hypothetical protein D3C75_725860 [compost metagenome]